MGKQGIDSSPCRVPNRISWTLGAYSLCRTMSMFLLFLLLFPLSNAFSSTFLIQGQENVYKISNTLEIYQNSPNPFPDSQITNGQFDDQFLPLQSLTGPLATYNFHWAKIELENQLADLHSTEDFVIEFSLILTDIEVFAVYENGKTIQNKSGFFTPINDRDFHPTNKRNLVRINLPKGEPVKLYIKAKSDRKWLAPKFDFKLFNGDYFNNKLKRQKQANGMFVGFILMILIYNLFLFVFNRDRAFVYYSVYLLSILLFALYNTGDLHDWLDKGFFANDPKRTYFIKISVYLFHISYLTFLRVFLRLPLLLPKWDKIFKLYILWVVIPTAILEMVAMVYTQFNYNIVDAVTIGSTIAFLILSISFLFPLYRTGDKKGYFIIGGYVFMGLGIILTIVARVQSIEFSAFFFKIGTILEIIIFSLGLAFRQRETEKRRQDAAFELERSQMLQKQKAMEAAQLEELNRMKTTFYTNITHEFRTPLTVIMGMVDNIKGHEQARKLIQRNSRNLLQLINQLLDLSKIDAGHSPVSAVQADIIPFLQYLTESFYSLSKEKNIELKLNAELNEMVMDFDETKIQHIINNLLSNALKFTKKGGKINLTISKKEIEKNNYLEIIIADNGIGIPAEKLPNIFNRFFQAHDKTIHAQEGTGIGLALTKEMTELMGGKIKVESEEGKGSTFTVLLPITNLADPPVKLIAPPRVAKTEKKPETVPKIDRSKTDKDMVLVIEDSPDVATYIKSILSEDYLIDLAADGQAGLDRAFETVPDLIITDVMMPVKDGYEVTQILKNDHRTSHIPIIMLTAKASGSDMMTGLRSGADTYLKKPFNKTELLIRIDNLMRLKKEIQQRYTSPILTQTVEKRIATEIKAAPPSIDDLFIHKLQKIIEERIEDTNLSIGDLCTNTGLSHSQLYRKLKALTNKTPIHFIRSHRLMKAQELLSQSEYNVSEVAYKVGFNDPNYFSRMYVQEFGHSPSESRK